MYPALCTIHLQLYPGSKAIRQKEMSEKMCVVSEIAKAIGEKLHVRDPKTIAFQQRSEEVKLLPLNTVFPLNALWMESMLLGQAEGEFTADFRERNPHISHAAVTFCVTQMNENPQMVIKMLKYGIASKLSELNKSNDNGKIIFVSVLTGVIATAILYYSGLHPRECLFMGFLLSLATGYFCGEKNQFKRSVTIEKAFPELANEEVKELWEGYLNALNTKEDLDETVLDSADDEWDEDKTYHTEDPFTEELTQAMHEDPRLSRRERISKDYHTEWELLSTGARPIKTKDD